MSDGYFDALMGVKRADHSYFVSPERFKVAPYMRFLCVVNGVLNSFQPAGRQVFSNYEDRLLLKLKIIHKVPEDCESLFAAVKWLRSKGNRVQVFEYNKDSKSSKDKYEVFL